MNATNEYRNGAPRATPPAGADVLVIGAGIVGAALAYHLARRGAAVTIVDAAEPGQGVTASSFAWLNAFHKTPRAYFDLNVAGMAEHQRLASELGGASWFHPAGGLQWADTAQEQAALRRDAERLTGWGYAIEAVAPSIVMRELEPSLRLDEASVAEVWHTPNEGWIDAPALGRELLRRAEADGAYLISGDAVTALPQDQGRVGRATLASGATVPAARVVICAGAATGRIAALAGVRAPLDLVPGLLAVTSGRGGAVRHVCHARDVAFRTDSSGGVLLGHAETLDATITPETPLVPPPAACGELLARASRYLPELAGTRIAAARIGVRPVPRDGVTIAGPSPEVERLYLAVTHSGVTLGPLLGRLLAEELADGAASHLLAPFRPARFDRGTVD